MNGRSATGVPCAILAEKENGSVVGQPRLTSDLASVGAHASLPRTLEAYTCFASDRGLLMCAELLTRAPLHQPCPHPQWPGFAKSSSLVRIPSCDSPQFLGHVASFGFFRLALGALYHVSLVRSATVGRSFRHAGYAGGRRRPSGISIRDGRS